jgi:hypothetical protein
MLKPQLGDNISRLQREKAKEPQFFIHVAV